MHFLAGSDCDGQKQTIFGVNRVGGSLFQFVESLVDPAAQIVALVLLMYWSGDDAYNHYLVFGVLLFAVGFPGKSLIQLRLRRCP